MFQQPALVPEEAKPVGNPGGTFWAAVVLTLFVLLTSGCGGSAEAHLEDYLEELEFEKPLKEMKVISLGLYRIPVAARFKDTTRNKEGVVWIKLRFNLIVNVAPEDERDVLNAIQRHRGMLDDSVLTVCRRATLDELGDARLATLKFRLTDAVRPILGERRIRRVLFTDFTNEPI